MIRLPFFETKPLFTWYLTNISRAIGTTQRVWILFLSTLKPITKKNQKTKTQLLSFLVSHRELPKLFLWLNSYSHFNFRFQPLHINHYDLTPPLLSFLSNRPFTLIRAMLTICFLWVAEYGAALVLILCSSHSWNVSAKHRIWPVTQWRKSSNANSKDIHPTE